MVIDSATGEAQKCFATEDGFMICNFVVRRGRVVRSRSGKCMKFRCRNRRHKRKPPSGFPEDGSKTQE